MDQVKLTQKFGQAVRIPDQLAGIFARIKDLDAPSVRAFSDEQNVTFYFPQENEFGRCMGLAGAFDDIFGPGSSGLQMQKEEQGSAINVLSQSYKGRYGVPEPLPANE